MLWWHNDKSDKEASERTEENPAGCAVEGKQSKGNIGEEDLLQQLNFMMK